MSALVILANGCEEMEAVITIDVLRRAGIGVTVAGLENSDPVKASRGVVIVPDVALASVDASTFTAVVLPGGLTGANSLAQSAVVGRILAEREAQPHRLVAAICAAPTVLQQHALFRGRTVTSYPSFKEALIADSGYKYSEDRVVVDGNLITSRGPGTSFEFALAIVKEICGADKLDEVQKPLLLSV